MSLQTAVQNQTPEVNVTHAVQNTEGETTVRFQEAEEHRNRCAVKTDVAMLYCGDTTQLKSTSNPKAPTAQ